MQWEWTQLVQGRCVCTVVVRDADAPAPPAPARPPLPPPLQGRATLEMKVHCNETPEGPQDVVQTIVLDGYNAPVSAGQFMDLVQRKFYDQMDIQRADGFVVQFGDPEGPEDGFVDPATKTIRRQERGGAERGGAERSGVFVCCVVPGWVGGSLVGRSVGWWGWCTNQGHACPHIARRRACACAPSAPTPARIPASTTNTNNPPTTPLSAALQGAV